MGHGASGEDDGNTLEAGISLRAWTQHEEETGQRMPEGIDVTKQNRRWRIMREDITDEYGLQGVRVATTP